MAYRGRGRGGYGRGRGGGGGFGYARQEPFFLFPEVELADPKAVREERMLVVWNSRLQNFWKSSPYHLEENVSKKNQNSMDIERYSDREKPKSTWERDSLDQILQLGSQNFPKELDGGLSKVRKRKRVRWNADSDLQKFDIFEKLESKHEGQGEKEKKENEDEEEEEDEIAESEGEFSDEGDYEQNIDFDDDDQDLEPDDYGGGGDDEGVY